MGEAEAQAPHSCHRRGVAVPGVKGRTFAVIAFEKYESAWWGLWQGPQCSTKVATGPIGPSHCGSYQSFRYSATRTHLGWDGGASSCHRTRTPLVATARGWMEGAGQKERATKSSLHCLRDQTHSLGGLPRPVVSSTVRVYPTSIDVFTYLHGHSSSNL